MLHSSALSTLDSARDLAVAQIRRAATTAARAVNEAVTAGAALIVLREQCRADGNFHSRSKPSDDQFAGILDEIAAEVGCTSRTLYNWIAAAEGTQSYLAQAVDIQAVTTPLAGLLTMPETELPESDREARQLLFSWLEDKTIKDAMAGVIVGGDDAARVKRASNGKFKGGTHAEDNRKDFPKFIAEHLADITTLLGARERDRQRRWNTMSAGERQRIADAFAGGIEVWPTPLLEELIRTAKEQLKQRS